MTPEEELAIAEWLSRVVLAGVMIFAGWFMFYLARYIRGRNFKRGEKIGIRTISTMASREAWHVAHVRAAKYVHISGFIACFSSLWVLIPYFSYQTASTGFYTIVMAVVGTVAYGAYLGDQAATEYLRDQADEPTE
ncbi:SdpI family protein [Arachnia propionica]|uniref:SdpI family protein n=1 Tax=Arachnia propionica TaxID=1750 RepID=UPI0030CCAD80